MSKAAFTLDVTSCRQCPHLKIIPTRHWMIPHTMYEYVCKKAGRNIFPEEGVKPPPRWCPMRDKDQEASDDE